MFGSWGAFDYQVRGGDTLSAIGDRFCTSADELQRINWLWDADQISAGQIIQIPSNSCSDSSRARYVQQDIRKNYVGYSSQTTSLGAAAYYVKHLIWPVSHAKFTSRFGRRWVSFHEGIDLAAPKGTQIRAAHSGKVVYSGRGLRGYGNIIVLEGNYGLTTVYAHNHRNLVSRGDRVSQGQVIGYVGRTGKASGPHVHFETRIYKKGKGNVAIDPSIFY